MNILSIVATYTEEMTVIGAEDILAAKQCGLECGDVKNKDHYQQCEMTGTLEQLKDYWMAVLSLDPDDVNMMWDSTVEIKEAAPMGVEFVKEQLVKICQKEYDKMVDLYWR